MKDWKIQNLKGLMLENCKDLDHIPDLFWIVNSLVHVHHFYHCPLSSGNANIWVIFHQKLNLHFFWYEKSSFFFSEIIQCSVSWTHHQSPLSGSVNHLFPLMKGRKWETITVSAYSVSRCNWKGYQLPLYKYRSFWRQKTIFSPTCL